MSKEKANKLQKYADSLSNRLSSPVSEKHAGNEKTYKQFLQRELEAASKKVESLKLSEKK